MFCFTIVASHIGIHRRSFIQSTRLPGLRPSSDNTAVVHLLRGYHPREITAHETRRSLSSTPAVAESLGCRELIRSSGSFMRYAELPWLSDTLSRLKRKIATLAVSSNVYAYTRSLRHGRPLSAIASLISVNRVALTSLSEN